MSTDVVSIIALSTLAGLGTGLGGLVVFVRKPGEKLLVFLMGLVAGIMIMLSFLELLFESLRLSGLFLAAAGFVAGSLILFLLDFLLPHWHFSVREKGIIDEKMLRAGLLIAIGISLHNLPEGIAVASGYSYMPKIGLIIAIAIALHNIPEGIANSFADSHGWSFKMGIISPSVSFGNGGTTGGCNCRNISQCFPRPDAIWTGLRSWSYGVHHSGRIDPSGT